MGQRCSSGQGGGGKHGAAACAASQPATRPRRRSAAQLHSLRRPRAAPAAAPATEPLTQSFLPRTLSTKHCGEWSRWGARRRGHLSQRSEQGGSS